MRIDKFTQKGQEALLEAQNMAEEYHHPAIEPEHLLKALAEQENGIVPAVLKRIGIDIRLLSQGIDQALNKMPRATGTTMQIGMSRDLVNILEEAETIAGQMKDDYT